jgi:hypothetical protein
MYIRNYVFRLTCLCSTLLVLSACAPFPITAPTQRLSPLATPGVASPSSAMETGLAVSPLSPPADVATRVPRVPGMGTVLGHLERSDGTPIKGITVYAALIEDRGGMRLAAIDPLLDVHAVTDAQGGFKLDNLVPGEYALATQSPVGIIMPHGTDGEIVEYTVEANRETALGRLVVGYVYPNSD